MSFTKRHSKARVMGLTAGIKLGIIIYCALIAFDKVSTSPTGQESSLLAQKEEVATTSPFKLAVETDENVRESGESPDPRSEEKVVIELDEVDKDIATTNGPQDEPVTEIPQSQPLATKNILAAFEYPKIPLRNKESPVTINFPLESIPTDKIGEIEGQKVIVGERSGCHCGRSNKRIVGGENASINQLPWTAALILKGREQGAYCGGTLINDRYVVTASHCVDGFPKERIEVWLFEEDFRVEDENELGTLKIDVEEIVMHSEYNANTIENDIALLKLAQAVNITDNFLVPACLPADPEVTFEDEDAIAAGWGTTSQGGNVSPTLQKVSVPVLSNSDCNRRTIYFGRITPGQVCAGYLTGGKDSCQGDSGGPLIVQKGISTLIGITSYGLGCAVIFAPGVYTRVSSYTDWIVKNTPDGEYCSLS